VLLAILVDEEVETAIFSTIGIIGEPGEDVSGSVTGTGAAASKEWHG
jgi:hypothetical protein